MLALAENADAAYPLGQEALAIAESVGSDALRSEARATIGLARLDRGDEAGGIDLERAAEIALAAGDLTRAGAAHQGLGSSYCLAIADEFIAESEAGTLDYSESRLRWFRACIQLA
jgi:hypothetical protein